jgi:hypothetical protein
MAIESVISKVRLQSSIYDVLATIPDKETYDSLKAQHLDRFLNPIWDFEEDFLNMPALYMYSTDCMDFAYPSVRVLFKYCGNIPTNLFQQVKKIVRSEYPDDNHTRHFLRSFNLLLVDSLNDEILKDTEVPLVSPSHYVLCTALVASRIGSENLRREYEDILRDKMSRYAGEERSDLEKFYRILHDHDLSKLDRLVKDADRWAALRDNKTHPDFFKPDYVVNDNTHFSGRVLEETVRIYVSMIDTFSKSRHLV